MQFQVHSHMLCKVDSDVKVIDSTINDSRCRMYINVIDKVASSICRKFSLYLYKDKYMKSD